MKQIVEFIERTHIPSSPKLSLQVNNWIIKHPAYKVEDIQTHVCEVNQNLHKVAYVIFTVPEEKKEI